jgi:hypothetical protein
MGDDEMAVSEEEKQALYAACMAIREYDGHVNLILEHAAIKRKIESEVVKQCSTNPELDFDELVLDVQNLLWAEIKDSPASSWEKVEPTTVLKWLESRIVWRLKTYVQRVCRIRYYKKTETEESRYEKVFEENIEGLSCRDQPSYNSTFIQNQRRLEELLRDSSIEPKYKFPIKLVIVDGYTVGDLARWFNCTAGNASGILKISMSKLKEYIFSLPEEERESILDIIRSL